MIDLPSTLEVCASMWLAFCEEVCRLQPASCLVRGESLRDQGTNTRSARLHQFTPEHRDVPDISSAVSPVGRRNRRHCRNSLLLLTRRLYIGNVSLSEAEMQRSKHDEAKPVAWVAGSGEYRSKWVRAPRALSDLFPIHLFPFGDRLH
jgi:hypothetical protein